MLCYIIYYVSAAGCVMGVLVTWTASAFDLLIGLLLGCVLSLLGFVRAFTWGMGSVVGVIVAVTVILVVLLGVLAGSMLPFVFEKFKLDPAVVSSPCKSTLTPA